MIRTQFREGVNAFCIIEALKQAKINSAATMVGKMGRGLRKNNVRIRIPKKIIDVIAISIVSSITPGNMICIVASYD